MLRITLKKLKQEQKKIAKISLFWVMTICMLTNLFALQANADDLAWKTPTKNDKLLKIKIDRTLKGKLKAVTIQIINKSKNDEVQKFQNNIVLSKWNDVQVYLANMNDKQFAQKIYQNILIQLASMPQENAKLTINDIIAIADMSPMEPNENTIQLLGKMLTQIMSTSSSAMANLDKKLQQGTKYFGGKDVHTKKNAAKLLSFAQKHTEATKYIPTLEEAKRNFDEEIVNYHLQHLQAIAGQTQNENDLQKLWNLNTWIYSTKKVSLRMKHNAWYSIMKLIPMLKNNIGDNWLKKQMKEDKEFNRSLLEYISNYIGSDSKTVTERTNSLILNQKLANAIIELYHPQSGSPWSEVLSILANGWIKESKLTIKDAQAREQEAIDEADRRLHYQYFIGRRKRKKKDFNSLDIKALLAVAPNKNLKWLDSLTTKTKTEVQASLIRCYLRYKEETDVLEIFKDLIATMPDNAQDLANEFIQSWTVKINPNYTAGAARGAKPHGIPLTRCRQIRNLKNLKKLLKFFKNKNIKIKDEIIVNAFEGCHSATEVYKLKEVKDVLGNIGDLPENILVQLANNMRTRLAKSWKDPKMQQKYFTNRTPKVLTQEINRGYEVMIMLLDEAISKNPTYWNYLVLKGLMTFDKSEYMYSKKAPLEEYIKMRNKAFASFEKAAKIYGESAESLEPVQRTTEIYIQWFKAILGASDLGYLTHKQEWDGKRLKQLQKAILSIPGENIAQEHLSKFGKQLSAVMPKIDPSIKLRLLQSAVQVIGNDPSIEPIRKTLAFYKELTDEISLEVTVDGSIEVGNKRNFGVFVNLLHSATISREGGGFSKYLTNGSGRQMGMPQKNYRDDFEKNIRNALADKFEIKSVSFQSPNVKAYPNNDGSVLNRSLPMAYIQLVAKDASEDKIPAIQLDMDFFDNTGQVILPIKSSEVHINAKNNTQKPRPYKNLEITQTLDERLLNTNKINLEIIVKGEGIIPDLKNLLKIDFKEQGFSPKITDSDSEVETITTDEENVIVNSKRTWTIELELTEKLQKQDKITFNLPTPIGKVKKFTNKRYLDADIVTLKSNTVTLGAKAKPSLKSRIIKILIILIIIAMIIAIIIFLVKNNKQEEVVIEHPYRMPATITPFTVVSLMRHIHADPNSGITTELKTKLLEEIIKLENLYFSKDTPKFEQAKLASTAKRWYGEVKF